MPAQEDTDSNCLPGQVEGDEAEAWGSQPATQTPCSDQQPEANNTSTLPGDGSGPGTVKEFAETGRRSTRGLADEDVSRLSVPRRNVSSVCLVEEDRKAHLEREQRDYMTALDKGSTFAVAVVALGIVITMCIWAKNGLHTHPDVGHHIITNTRVGHVLSPLYRAPVAIFIPGSNHEYFEVRLIGMATYNSSNLAWHGGGKHRRLGTHPTGSITYALMADGVEFYRQVVQLEVYDEVESFDEIDVREHGKHEASEYTVAVTANMEDGAEMPSFALQVVRMGWGGRYRKLIGIIIFVTTFIGIVSEVVHRSYAAMLGSSAVLCTVSAIQETPPLHAVTGFIDWGTLGLLFSMMILMGMLSSTGFFNWCALQVVKMSNQNAKVMFFALTNICGFLSMFLDNVTCVMLFGPLTMNLAKQMHMNPRYLYLSMTICATVGGTATLIGDPPNIVIGSKMQVGFDKFLFYNAPIVSVVLLPACSWMLYYRVKDKLFEKDAPLVKLDLVALAEENRILDKSMFAQLGVVFFAIFLALCLHPVHHVEPAWFTMMAMFGCAILFEPHKMGEYLEYVEWDTLLFFALLFVLVEGLSELGVIRLLGDGIIAFIELFPDDGRTAVAIIVILWVSAIGSAFLESLPYTTTVVYILLGMRTQTINGIEDTDMLVWPLSVGACVGGIGSIMGSSANLVCMAVSSRYSDRHEHKVQGGDFLRYGLPNMFVLVFICMIWQLILFVGFKAY